jgi:hypothetical protein
MGNIDRRLLYAIAFVVMFLPLLMDLPLPVATNPRSLAVYEMIEGLEQPPGQNLIILSTNFSPDTLGESLPQSQALLRHMLLSGKKFAIFSLSATAAAGHELVNTEAIRIAEELRETHGLDRRYGVDWVNLGFRPANAPILAGFAANIPAFFRTDVRGTPIDQIPVMRGIQDAGDLGLVIDVSPSGTYNFWMPAVTDKFNIPLLLAPTSVMVPDTYPFLASGQVRGVIRGVLGAAEYEALMELHDPEHELPRTARLGTRQMTSVAALDAYIIVLIIIGNIAYIRQRREETQ